MSDINRLVQGVCRTQAMMAFNGLPDGWRQLQGADLT